MPDAADLKSFTAGSFIETLESLLKPHLCAKHGSRGAAPENSPHF
jgi:hypothetical protein